MLSRAQKAILVLLGVGWLALSVWSFDYLIESQKEERHCGTIRGFYEVSGKRSTSEYVMINFDSIGHRDLYAPWVSGLYGKGDRVCMMLRITDDVKQESGFAIILSLVVSVVNAMGIALLVMFGSYRVWRAAGNDSGGGAFV